MRVKTLLN